MDQIKIGKFISALRKEKELTQAQLAEKLGITDTAVSKWERGLSLPDSGIMLELCEILGITVNELLSGERLVMENYNKKAEENLLEMKKQKEETDKRLLKTEIVLGVISCLFYFSIIGIASLVDINEKLRLILIFGGLIPFFIAMMYCTKIEQTAGYYECQNCHHKYVPTYMSVFLAMHINRTRYMKCPNCGKRTWQRKTINKD